IRTGNADRDAASGRRQYLPGPVPQQRVRRLGNDPRDREWQPPERTAERRFRFRLLRAAPVAAAHPTRAWLPEPGLVDLVVQLGLQERRRWLHQAIAGDRLSAEQHAVAHHVAVRQRQLDAPLPIADADRRLDDVALLDLAVGASHLAPVDDAGGAFD